MNQPLESVVNLQRHPLQDDQYRSECKKTLDRDGALVMPGFLDATAIDAIQRQGDQHQNLAYYTVDSHNVYLQPSDPGFADGHPRNRSVSSSKGCITDDQIPTQSQLRTLYDSALFRDFLCAVLDESELHNYADPLSSINLHYASEGQELGWHFDNSSFAITLLIRKPDDGGRFEYVKDVRDADRGEMNYDQAGQVLDGEIACQTLAMDAGTLVLFRGRNSMHRVTPTIGDTTRMLVVLAYNTTPGVALSESARMTFYGRLE